MTTARPTAKHQFRLHLSGRKFDRFSGKKRVPEKEAAARIKINRLLEAAGWRFSADQTGPANVRLESAISIDPPEMESLGDDFQGSKTGFVDFLLFDA
jgi:type I restriction enzyme R subunit